MRVPKTVLLFALAAVVISCSSFDREKYEDDVRGSVVAGNTSLAYQPLTVTEVAGLDPESWVAVVREEPSGAMTITRAGAHWCLHAS